MPRMSWEQYALELAQVASLRSEDPYPNRQVGACVLRHDNSVAGLGYNGPPSGVNIDWSDRDKRLGKVIHAEKNALRYCRPGEGRLLACTLLPCPTCLNEIAGYGIKYVIYRDLYERDSSSLSLAKDLKIKLVTLDELAKEQAHLSLWQRFHKWLDSLPPSTGPQGL